ncbi:unnamed protein product [Lepidochelys kempii]
MLLSLPSAWSQQGFQSLDSYQGGLGQWLKQCSFLFQHFSKHPPFPQPLPPAPPSCSSQKGLERKEHSWRGGGGRKEEAGTQPLVKPWQLLKRKDSENATVALEVSG